MASKQYLTTDEAIEYIYVSNEAKANRPFGRLVALGILAGIFIGVAGMFYTLITTATPDVAFGPKKMLASIGFATGFVVVIVLGTDLFTSNTLTFFNFLMKKEKFSTVFKNWVMIYIANLVGSLLLAIFLIIGGTKLVDHGQFGANFMHVADAKMNHTFIQAVFLGFIANFLVCLAYIASIFATSIQGKIFALLLPIMAFVACGFEHSIANQFLLPIGYYIHEYSDQSYWDMIGKVPADYPHITLSNLFMQNLIPATIGNTLAGIAWGFFLKYGFVTKK